MKMYLHLGNDYIVNSKDIVGIFDLEKTSVSKFTKEFLSAKTKNKRIVNCTFEMPKSFIVTLDKEYTEIVYISQISCAALKNRFIKNKL